MQHVRLILLIILFCSSDLTAHEVVLKSGKTIRGTLIREDAQLIILKDELGMYHNFNKSEVDLEKTAALNKTSVSEDRNTKRIYTDKDVDRLREKFDLGQGSYGESSRIDISDLEEPSEAQNEQLAAFEEAVLRSEEPVLVEFWAEWCGPCKKLAPVINRVAGQFEGEVKVVKVNIDTDRAIASAYQIRAIPTMLFFKSGEVVDRLVGAVSERILLDKLQSVLQKDQTSALR